MLEGLSPTFKLLMVHSVLFIFSLIVDNADTAEHQVSAHQMFLEINDLK